ncbi:hypothetical protein WOLCODRAFT_15032 [Wolfiporia cocos MD-104 SS10]|uniref:Uncharacterized protein n=1 Tax=Wolfiporia cocos (strain MD-104) TaxID=742152 RepID=A0A2H3IVI2_WOLCO|nr:hypothetical protein WOLCODRAFT_15032 [Wolfiporia cocos MD-104 SS10]
MSSPLLPPSQSKPWWSRSKSPKEPSNLSPPRSFSDDSEKMSTSTRGSAKQKDSSAGLRFKTLGSAIGLKSKKLPSLAIQDPPSLPAPHSPFSAQHDAAHAPSSFYTNRPPAKSVSTVRSIEFDGDATSARTVSEPRTPSDYTRDRTSYQPSVLTFSEMDPFAAGGVIVQHAPHDANRLSVYSDSSLLDPHRKSGEIPMLYNRISYGSTSSNSHSQSSDSHSARLASPRSTQSGRPLPDGSRVRQNSLLRRDVPLDIPEAESQRSVPYGSQSSTSTVTSGDGHSRLSEPPSGGEFLHPRHVQGLRARGMTIATAGEGSRCNAVPPSAAPLYLRRKASDLSYFNSSSSASSPSPLSFSRSRSSTTDGTDSPVSPATRPLVVVRKASSSRVHLPPPSARPPADELPPPPGSPWHSPDAASSRDDISFSAFPRPPSSSSSSMSFAPSIDDLDGSPGGPLDHRVRHAPAAPAKSKRRMHRANTDFGQTATLRSIALDMAALPSASSGSAFPPPLPAHIRHGADGPPPRLLKKAASQQSLLSKRYSAASVASSAAYADDGAQARSAAAAPAAGKAPRKQRSFHHSRLPLPPMPTLRHATSSGAQDPVPPPPPPLSPAPTESQARRGSSGATRKRLFSGPSMRRGSASQPAQDDDVRSVSSVDERRGGREKEREREKEKVVMSFGARGNPLALLTSNACVAPQAYLDGQGACPSPTGEGVLPSKRVSQTDYVPQRIMSPADMLKLEQQLADEAAAKDNEDRRPRLELHMGLINGRQKSDARSNKSRLSTMSAGTLAFGLSDEQNASENSSMLNQPLSSSASTRSRQNSTVISPTRLDIVTEGVRQPARSHSVLGKNLAKPALSVRPSTAQPSLPSPAMSTFTHTYSPERAPVSLPPPPRARPAREQQQAQQADRDRRASVVPIQPLSPPPRAVRRPSVASTATARSQQSSHSSRPPSAFDAKALKRRSIMRKPSFLEIGDELEDTAEDEDEDEGAEQRDERPLSPPVEDSFLDMERGSFDTIRSSDSMLYV